MNNATISTMSCRGLRHLNKGKTNEDGCMTFQNGNLKWVVVCDGISGSGNGDTAVSVAMSGICRVVSHPIQNEDMRHLCLRAAMAAQEEVLKGCQDDSTKSGMGCTLSMLCLDQSHSKAHIINIGDSAVFRISNHEISQLTREDSLIGAMVDKGDLSDEDARKTISGHELDKWLGMNDLGEDGLYGVCNYKNGDSFIVCSDGLHGKVDKNAILRCIESSRKPEDVIESLYNLALKRASTDDITIAYCRAIGARGKRRKSKFAISFIIATVISAWAGGFVGYMIANRQFVSPKCHTEASIFSVNDSTTCTSDTTILVQTDSLHKDNTTYLGGTQNESKN